MRTVFGLDVRSLAVGRILLGLTFLADILARVMNAS